MTRSLTMVLILLVLYAAPYACGRKGPLPSHDKVPPRVSFTSPVAGAQNVAANSVVSITFSEPMDPSTIDEKRILVMVNNSVVPGSVTYSEPTAEFHPAEEFAVQTNYIVMISSGVTDAAGNPMEQPYSYFFTTGQAQDTTPPQVIATSPADHATGVSLKGTISLTFSEAMQTGTISLLVTSGSGSVSGTVSVLGNAVVFTPSGEFEPMTTYYARVSASALDLAGNALGSDHAWSFTTGQALDTAPPQVLATVPADHETGVSVNSTISLTFSEAMQTGTVSLIVESDSTTVAGTVSLVGNSAVFTPSGEFDPVTTYYARVSASAQDLAGNAMGVDHVWSFTTGSKADIEAPTVLSVSPPAGAANVDTGTTVLITFSEPMDPSTINEQTITVTVNDDLVPGSVTYREPAAEFRPAKEFSALTSYVVAISPGVTDAAGNPLEQPYSCLFTTGQAQEKTPPRVLSTSPIDDATGVSMNASISVTFSESMRTDTIALIVTGGSGTVSGTASYPGNSVVFMPSMEFAKKSIYAVRVPASAQDAAGNALGVDHVWSFTTGDKRDTARPTVKSTSPSAGADNVAVNTAVLISFSENMDADTLTTDTIQLSTLWGDRVAGTIIPGATTATFEPLVSLAPQSTYLIRVTTGVKDTAGNAMDKNFLRTFETGSLPDADVSQVTAAIPAQDQGSVEGSMYPGAE